MHENTWGLCCGICRVEAERTSPHGRCGKCNGPIVYERLMPLQQRVGRAEIGIWRWKDWISLSERSEISLGEGSTPLIGAPDLAERYGIGELWLKLESRCPTGSFKDRAVVAAIDEAVSQSAAGIVCASSGNAAASAAAYGARAGIPVVLFVPESTPIGKLNFASSYGAAVVRVPGDYSSAYHLAEEFATSYDFANTTTTYRNAKGVVGLRTVSYELSEDLDRIDAVFVPTGAGPLVYGIAKGFEDISAMDTSMMTRVFAVQPEGCAPIAKAFSEGMELVHSWNKPMTSVSGLDDPLRGYPEDGTLTLKTIRDTGGEAYAVSDRATNAARARLASSAGIDAEPAAATSLVGVERAARTGVVGEHDVVVCVITGSGMKVPVVDQARQVISRDVKEVASIVFGSMKNSDATNNQRI